jgi:UDP-N-acetylmuramyl-tripeptide synthetase
LAVTRVGIDFDVVEDGERHRLATRLVGLYNVSNVLGVIAAMRALGVPMAACVRACGSLKPVPGRMECVGGDNEPLVAIDYAHTPDALAKALDALKPVAQAREGRLWCVFGCGGDRDAGKRPMMGAVASGRADRVVVTSDNPRSEKPQSIISQILLGMAGCDHVEVESDRAAGISKALAGAGNRDVVLIAGKGHETYQDIDGKKLPFSDLEQARVALARKSARSTAC